MKCFSVSQRSCSDCRFSPYSTGNSNFSPLCSEQLDRLRVADPLEGPLDHKIEPREQLLVDEFREKPEVLRTVLANIADEIFHHLLGQIHVALQIAEGHLRLDHPELVSVPRSVRVLRAKSRAKGVNLGERAGESFGLELAADRQVSASARKNPSRNRSPPSLAAAADFWVKRRDPKQLARAFAIAPGDDRRVHVNKAAFLEKLVHGKGEPAADAKDRAEQIRARPQVRDLAQKLRSVPFLLQRIRYRPTLPTISISSATTSQLWPFPCEATSGPRTRMEAPVVRRWTAS